MLKRRVLAIIGRPGTGKSATVRAFMRDNGDDWKLEALAPLLVGHVCGRLTILGDYSDAGETFPGTDRLSMSVAPAALDWIRQSDGDVLFEGDRLGNGSTLRELQRTEGIELSVWCLVAPEHELVRRYMLRGSAQKDLVLRARATKVTNICASLSLDVERRLNVTELDQAFIVRDIELYFARGRDS